MKKSKDGKTVHQECSRCKAQRSYVDTYGTMCNNDGKRTYVNFRGKNVKYTHVWKY